MIISGKTQKIKIISEITQTNKQTNKHNYVSTGRTREIAYLVCEVELNKKKLSGYGSPDIISILLIKPTFKDAHIFTYFFYPLVMAAASQGIASFSTVPVSRIAPPVGPTCRRETTRRVSAGCQEHLVTIRLGPQPHLNHPRDWTSQCHLSLS